MNQKHLVLLLLVSGCFSFVFSQSKNKPSNSHLFKLDTLVTPSMKMKIFKQYLHMSDQDGMTLINKERDYFGMMHEKYQQTHKKIPVEGAIVTMHLQGDQLMTMSSDFVNIQSMDIEPEITESQALETAMKKLGATHYSWEEPYRQLYKNASKPKGELVIVSDEIAPIKGVHLVWKFDIIAHQPAIRSILYVEARKGTVLMENSRVNEIDTSGSIFTIYNGQQSVTTDFNGSYFRLQQASRGNGIQTFNLANGTNYENALEITSNDNNFLEDPVSNQIFWGLSKTYDYYYFIHHRNSYDNEGGIIKGYSHFSRGYNSAFWNGSVMTFGDGDSIRFGSFAAIDVTGHELTHALTQYSANLFYQNESGALNESFSDIFGECVENFATQKNDWLLSCQIGLNGKCGAIRSMINPDLFFHPGTYLGTNWYRGEGDRGGVHRNSGVQNKWFYILAHGDTSTNDHNLSYQVTGIGLEKAASIAYRNLVYYLTPFANYQRAREGSIQAAIDLFGNNSLEVQEVTAAWDAVGVYDTRLDYCTSQSNQVLYAWIDQVKIDAQAPLNTGSSFYSDFTNYVFEVKKDTPVSVRLTPGFWDNQVLPQYWKIWVDYNRDYDFEDPGEFVFDTTVLNGLFNESISASIVFHNNNSISSTRMRIVLSIEDNNDPCQVVNYGEVEDYTLAFVNNLTQTQNPNAPFTNSNNNAATSPSTLRIFPNPAKDYFYVQSNEQLISIKIFNISGQALLNFEHPSTTVNISNLKKGLYLASIQTKKGIYHYKLIKE